MPCSSSVCILYRLEPLTPPSCPERAHYLTSALHHCLNFFMTLSCSYVPHVDRIHDLHLSTYLPFPFLTAILPFLFYLFALLLRVCLSISVYILSDTVLALQPNPISSLTYIVPYSCVLCPIPAAASTHVGRANNIHPSSNVGKHSRSDHSRYCLLVPIPLASSPLLPNP